MWACPGGELVDNQGDGDLGAADGCFHLAGVGGAESPEAVHLARLGELRESQEETRVTYILLVSFVCSGTKNVFTSLKSKED